MKLSTRSRYGIHAMYDLAVCGPGEPQSIKAIAERQKIPEAYLEQLLGALRRAGLVTTVRGAQGGYLLARPPEKITVRNILEAAEGPLSFSDCVTHPESPCERSAHCPAKGVWEYLTGEINSLLDRITLADMETKA